MERNIYKVCTVYISDHTGGLGKGKQFLKITRVRNIITNKL